MFEGIFSAPHLILILVIVLIIFGPGKLPDIGRSLGGAIKSFKSAVSEHEKKPGEINDADKKPEV